MKICCNQFYDMLIIFLPLFINVSFLGYYNEGFLSLQHVIDNVILKLLNVTLDNTLSLHLQRFPYPPYNDDKFVLVLQNQFPSLIMLSFVFSALNIVKNIVMEKEKRIKVLIKLFFLS